MAEMWTGDVHGLAARVVELEEAIRWVVTQ